MNSQKMRMCPFCEGTNPIDESSCKFCGSQFEVEKPKRQERVNHAHMPRDLGGNHQNSNYQAPYSPSMAINEESVYYRENDTTEDEEDEEAYEEKEQGHIVSLTLLSTGFMLLTLSMLLLFFAEHGRVVLEWKSRYWSLYLLTGLPMVYYGIKKLRSL